MRALVHRAIRAVKLLARDGAIPKPVRWAAVVGLAPIPGPFDEVVLLFVAAILWLVYPDRLREAWRRADSPAPASSA